MFPNQQRLSSSQRTLTTRQDLCDYLGLYAELLVTGDVGLTLETYWRNAAVFVVE